NFLSCQSVPPGRDQSAMSNRQSAIGNSCGTSATCCHVCCHVCCYVCWDAHRGGVRAAFSLFLLSPGKWVNFRSFPPSIFVSRMICPAWWENARQRGKQPASR